MKAPLLAICSSLILTSCAHMHVVRTEVATGAVNPSAIYIRPFSVRCTQFRPDPCLYGAAIQRSLAPALFADDLQEELAKLAPAMVIRDDQIATHGWLVEGEFEQIDEGDRRYRAATAGFSGEGRSFVVLHVRVTDLNRRSVTAGIDHKEGVTAAQGINTRNGLVIYEFDLAGGSGNSGAFGSILAPGLGNAEPFDFRNAAEKIMLTLSPDPFRYGFRSSPSQNL